MLANVKPARYLEPFAPTGITGLVTHPSPRPTLIYLYTTTLQKLKAFPESSVYRQSTEAVTRHRLQIVESTKPPGYEAWLERVKKAIGTEPERFASLLRPDGSYAGVLRGDGSDNPRGEEWDGEALEPTSEGPARTPEEEARWHQAIEDSTNAENESDFHTHAMKWENEPALEAEQYVLTLHFLLETKLTINLRIAEIENQIGAGLLEEVIQVAEGELKLVDEMSKSKV